MCSTLIWLFVLIIYLCEGLTWSYVFLFIYVCVGTGVVVLFDTNPWLGKLEMLVIGLGKLFFV
jgi:hypothetical protein